MSKQTSSFAAAVRRAKQLYKTGRYASFADAVRAAYRKGGSGTKKKRSSRKVVRRSSAQPKARSRKRTGGVASARSKYRSELSERLKTYLYLKDRASTVRLKKQYGKIIAGIKRQLKNLS